MSLLPLSLVCWLLGGLWAAPALALAPDQLALVVNAKVPAGVQLAELYAHQRHVPDGRIIALDLPDGDDIDFAAYNQQVVPAVRKALAERGLQQKVTCLVTFWGVPLRIGRKPASAAEVEELHAVDAAIKQETDRARAATHAAEALAQELDPSFKPNGNDALAAMPGRADAAVDSVLRALARDEDPARRAVRFTRLLAQVEVLAGPVQTTQRLATPPYARLAPRPPTREQLAAADAHTAKLVEEVRGLLAQSDSPQARATVRERIRDNFGAFSYLSLLNEQKIRLMTEESEAAFDSELALVWWDQGYPRYRWQQNPLYYKLRFHENHQENHDGRDAAASRPPARAAAAPGAGPAATQPAVGGQSPNPPPVPPALMVMRIDAPTEQLAHDLIVTSLRVEKEGLKGQIALDARGKSPPDPYGVYDQSIRNLAALLKSKTRLKDWPVVFDDTEAVFPKGSVKDVAVYCGWYSLRKYIPGMAFRPGAVAFHVASAELVSLHNPRETGWVHGLMSDGVVATLGPVAEPYLHSFPAADEFFPLLLTGKLTLAEVYWLTNPLSSWMNACIGDPLYNPFAASPALQVEDVPPRLHVIFEQNRMAAGTGGGG